MKKFNIILLLLCCLTSVGYAQIEVGNKAKPEVGIQKRGYAAGEDYTFQTGDTIIIDVGAINYLTGETMSKWVYNVPHLVQQVGGKRFPDGLLIQGINSWISKNATKLMHPSQPVAKPAEQPAQPVVQPAEPVVETPVVAVPVEEPVTPVVEDTTAVVDTVVAEPQIIVEEDSMAHQVYAPKYQANRFSIGLRGGVAQFMHDAQGMSDALGWDALLDLQYAHYWKNGNKPALGILFGASVGYMRGGMKGSVDQTFQKQTVTDPVDVIDYHVTATEVKEVQDQLMLEVPIMFTMVTTKGFFLNVGPRLSFPVWARSKVTMTEPYIDAYYNAEGVHVYNEMITGKITDDQNPSVGSWNKPILNILVGAELGYEFKFTNGNAFGIGVYGNYGAYSLYKRPENATSIFDIVPPYYDTPAVVKVVSPSDVFTNKLGMFDAGLKLTFHFHKQRISL